jgi:hypothetical protein
MAAIPEVLQTKQLTTMSNMSIFTSILDPTTSSQDRVSFTLRQQGVLDSGSRFMFSIHPNSQAASDADDCFLPVFAGAKAAIKSCTIRFGTTIYAQTSDANHYMTMRKSVHSTSQKKNIDMVLDGSCSNVGPSLHTDGLYGMADSIYSTSQTSVVPVKYKLKKSETDSNTFSIGISELIPAFRNLQLPLFAMENPMIVDIEFQKQSSSELGKVCCFSNEPTDSSTTLGLNNMKMMIDYLMYEDDVMAEIKNSVNSQTGLSLSYDDIALTTTNLPAQGIPASGSITNVDVVRTIGSAGLNVKNVVLQQNLETQELDSVSFPTLASRGVLAVSVTPPAVTIVPSRDGATASCTIAGITPVITSTPGTAYTGAGTVVFAAPLGTQPDGTAGVTQTGSLALSGSTIVYTQTVAGSGYVGTETVTLAGQVAGTGFTVTLTAAPVVKSVTFTNRGSGYSTPPTLTFAGSTTPPSPTVTIRPFSNKLAGDYYSEAPVHLPETQYRVNDLQIYPRRLKSPEYYRSEVEQVLEYPLSVPNCIYSKDLENNFYASNDGGQNPMLDDASKMEGHSPTLLAGRQFYQGLQLRKGDGGEGTQIGNVNILHEAQMKYSHKDFEKRVVRYFVEHERDFVLQNGIVNVSA